MSKTERIANVIGRLLEIVGRWTTKKTLIEWYENECKKDTLIVIYVVYKGVDSKICTYTEQRVVQESSEILDALEEVRNEINRYVFDSGYTVVENKLIREVINQHLTVDSGTCFSAGTQITNNLNVLGGITP